MDIITCIILILLIFLVGYSIGRRIGLSEGYRRGINYAPLQMRGEMMKTGICPLCKDDN